MLFAYIEWVGDTGETGNDASIGIGLQKLNDERNEVSHDSDGVDDSANNSSRAVVRSIKGRTSDDSQKGLSRCSTVMLAFSS